MREAAMAEGGSAEGELEPLRFPRLWADGFFEVPASERVRDGAVRPWGGDLGGAGPGGESSGLEEGSRVQAGAVPAAEGPGAALPSGRASLRSWEAPPRGSSCP